ncbi:Laccase-5, partial [Armadillidium nasatum]
MISLGRRNRKRMNSHFEKQTNFLIFAEWYITMSKACFDCPFNITDCLRPHCVVADGYEKAIVTVNRRLPGPSIQVCEDDEIIVDLINELGTDTTTIHWHGVHQVGTPYMDGVPSLTQCPINGGNLFRYHFIADPAGTHFWHSHSGFQRADGMIGSLIVRSRNDSHKSLYDVDDPEHVILVTDWMDKLGIDKFVNHHHTEHENKPYNILVNGLGKYKPLRKGNESSYTPLYEIVVKPGLRYRIRSISNSIQNCPTEISVDNHKLLVIASDGQNLQPLEVDSLVIYGGERWDFVVNANQEPGVYWVKFNGLLDCDNRFFSA